MNTSKRTSLLFRHTDPSKKRTILAVLITFCFTASAALVLVAARNHGSWWYLEAAAFFVAGLVFLIERRQIRVSNPHDPEPERRA